MNGLSLYQLTGERLALRNKLEAMDFDSETIQDTLEAESTEIQRKIESYGFVIKEMEAFTEAMKSEEKRMADRRKAQEAKIERIKSWLLTNMQACEITKIECPAFTIAVRSNPAKVVIDNEGSIPSELFTYPEAPPPTPNKKAIADALKAGTDVPGCHLEQGARIVIS